MCMIGFPYICMHVCGPHTLLVRPKESIIVSGTGKTNGNESLSWSWEQNTDPLQEH